MSTVMGNNEAKAKELLLMLCRNTNGAAAGSMKEKGLVYGTNYGVSIADIRNTCKDFAPDHELAKHVYPQDVRELRLAAFFIADPELLVPEEFPFWAEGVTTTELGSNAALSFFSKSPAADALIFEWLRPGNRYLSMFTAVMTAAGNLMHREGRVDWDWRILLDVIFERTREPKDPGSKAFLRECLAALMLRLLALTELDNKTASEYITRISAVNANLGDYLDREVGWALV